MPTPQYHLQNASDMFVKVAADPIAVVTSAATMASSPWWLPAFRDLHEYAALWLPILGCLLAILQIIAVVLKIKRGAAGD